MPEWLAKAMQNVLKTVLMTLEGQQLLELLKQTQLGNHAS